MPDKENVSVSVNTGPIIALSLIGYFDLLNRFYKPVYVARAVEEEICFGGQNSPGYRELLQADWISRYELRKFLPPLLSMQLDPGEAETVASALELGIKRVVIDESIGRGIASYLGLYPTGTVGILLRAKREGCIPEIRPLLDELMRKRFRLKRQLYEWALSEAGE